MINKKLLKKYEIKVDPKVSIERLVKLGKYHLVDPLLTSANFPAIQASYYYLTVYLWSGEDVFSSDFALSMEELAQTRYRPLNIRELAHFGFQYPFVHTNYVGIYGLGTIFDSGRENAHGQPQKLVPFLSYEQHDDGREILVPCPRVRGFVLKDTLQVAGSGVPVPGWYCCMALAKKK